MRTRAIYWWWAALAVVTLAALEDASAGVKWEGSRLVQPLPAEQEAPAPADIQTAGLPGILGLPGGRGPGRVARLDPPQCVPLEIAGAWLSGEAFSSVNRLRVVNLHLKHEGDRLCVRAAWRSGP